MASVRKREWTHKGHAKTAWVVNYTDEGGRRRLKTFDLKKDADKYRTKVEMEIEKGVHTPFSKTVTVAQVCELFLRHVDEKLRDGRVSRSHQSRLKNDCNRHIVPNIGRMLLTDLTVVQVEGLYSVLCSGSLIPRTAKYVIGVLRMIMDFAVKRGMLKTHIVRDAMSDLKGIGQARIRTLSVEEVKKIITAAAERPPGRRRHMHAVVNCMVHLAAFCGLRYGEIAGLKIDNVDFDRRVVRVKTGLTRFREIKGPKTPAGVRDVPMPQHVATLLSAIIPIANRNRLLLTAENGAPLCYGNFYNQSWRNLLERAGLIDDGPRIHFHALRHFAASWMIDTGYSIMDTAHMLGHKSFDMTLQTYAHPVMDDAGRGEMMDRMASRLGQGSQAIADATGLRQGDVSC